MADQPKPDWSAEAGERAKAGATELNDAVGNLQDAFNRLRTAVEATAKDEIERAKPEVRSVVNDALGMIDALSERAKVALTEVAKRIDPEEDKRNLN